MDEISAWIDQCLKECGNPSKGRRPWSNRGLLLNAGAETVDHDGPNSLELRALWDLH